MNTRRATAVRSRDEIAEAIRALTEAQWARLRRVSERFAWGRPIAPGDLLHEAFIRALEEDGRKCPADIDVVKFLIGAMRSIVHGEAEKAKKVKLVPVARHSDQHDEGVDVEDPTPNAEAALIEEEAAAEIRREVLALFDDDRQARDLVEGIFAGFTAEELRELTGLDETGYASKRKLIRRRIDKKYPNGWRP